MFSRLIDKKKLFPLYSAVFTAVIFLIVLALNNICGYGNNTILSGDLFSQYSAFIQSFINTIKGNGSFYYSFSVFLGNPVTASYAYYCLSPFNLLYLLPVISVSAMTLIIIMLKLSLAAAAFQFYLNRGLKEKSPFTIFFGTAYALCAFAVSMFVHIMWLDALYTLPILLLLIIRFVKGSSFLPLVPAYAYLFLTNFYMGYITGIFSALCFIALLVFYQPSWDRSNVIKAIKRGMLYAFSVILGAACCAAVLLPAALELFNKDSSRSSFSLYSVTIPDVIGNLFLGEMQGMGSPIPLVYCGLPVLILAFVYFCCHSISKKEKLLSGFLLLFYLAATQFLPLYQFLHAMEAPNWYAHRYSFCIVLVLLSISCRALPYIREVKGKTLVGYTAGLLLMYTVLIPFQELCYPGYHTNTHGWLILNAAFLSLYLLLLHFRPNQFALCITALFTLEILINGYTCVSRNDFGFHSEEMIEQWENTEAATIPELQKADPSFYRIRVNGELCFNAPSRFHYAGINSFTTTDNAKLRETLSSLGIATSFMSIYDHGYTDITDMLFGIKYNLDLGSGQLGGSPLALPLGFMCSASTLAWENSQDVFTNQENLVSLMCNYPYSLYTPVNIDEENMVTRNMEILPFENAILFQHISDMVANGVIRFRFPDLNGHTILAHFPTCEEPVIRGSSPEADIPVTGFSKSTNLSDGSIFCSTCGEDGVPEIGLVFHDGADYDYAVKEIQLRDYDDSLLPELHDDLCRQPFVIDKYNDSYVSGTVEATEDRPLLFLSIPYSEGWEALVDGAPSPVLSVVNDSFSGLYLTPGVHKVILQYNHPGASAGNMISGCAIILFLILLLLNSRKKTAAAVTESKKDEDNKGAEA